MGSFFDSLRAKMATFMFGRYGADQLGRALMYTAIICIVISCFGLTVFNTIAFVVLIYATFRMFSRNHTARASENDWYLRVSEKPRSWWNMLNLRWSNRKTTVYIKCPHCHKTFTLPKGKGKIRATCPHCHEQSVHNV